MERPAVDPEDPGQGRPVVGDLTPERRRIVWDAVPVGVQFEGNQSRVQFSNLVRIHELQDAARL